jgi:hypothetical protein
MTRRLPEGSVSEAQANKLADLIEERFPVHGKLPTSPTINRALKCGNARAEIARRVVIGRRREIRRIPGITPD